MKIGVLIISDRGSRGEYQDKSTPIIVDLLANHPTFTLSKQAIIPDNFDTIVETMKNWCDAGINLLLTSGGTGFSPRDVTPEATKHVIEREAPGIAEALRADSLKITKHAILSRAVAGIRKQTLIINMPGNPKAVKENMQFLLPMLPHALDLLVDADHTEQDHRSI